MDPLQVMDPDHLESLFRFLHPMWRQSGRRSFESGGVSFGHTLSVYGYLNPGKSAEETWTTPVPIPVRESRSNPTVEGHSG